MPKKKTREEFIEDAIKVHGNKFDYSKVEYINARTKVCIICPEHGEFWQTPTSHLQGQGCPKCAIQKNIINRKFNSIIKYKELFLIKAQKVHQNTYTYDISNLEKSSDKVTINCPYHGPFQQEANAHLKGQGCPKCKGGVKYSTKEFIEKAIKIHGNDYSYDKVVYINKKTKVCIKCNKCDKEFWQRPGIHLQGHGCPKCGILKNKIWDEESCIKEAKKYNCKSDLIKNRRGCYDAMLKNNILDKCNWLQDNRINKNKDKIDSVYCYIFEKEKCVYVGRTLMSRQQIRDNAHRTGKYIIKNKKRISTSAVFQFASNNNLEIPQMQILEENLTIKEGQIKEKVYCEKFKKNGYILLNKAKVGLNTGSLGAIDFGKWNYKTCKEEAKKYKSRSEFHQNSSGAYKVSLQKGYLNEFFPNKKQRLGRTVYKIDINTNQIIEETTTIQAIEFYGVGIYKCLENKRNTCGGFKWKYKE